MGFTRRIQFGRYPGLGLCPAEICGRPRGLNWEREASETLKKIVCPRGKKGSTQSHLPIMNRSLKTLAAQRARHKVYVHINNTNPILWRSGPERQLLEEMGIQVAADGMRIEV